MLILLLIFNFSFAGDSNLNLSGEAQELNGWSGRVSENGGKIKKYVDEFDPKKLKRDPNG